MCSFSLSILPSVSFARFDGEIYWISFHPPGRSNVHILPLYRMCRNISLILVTLEILCSSLFFKETPTTILLLPKKEKYYYTYDREGE
jgi:hypothetical protein